MKPVGCGAITGRGFAVGALPGLPARGHTEPGAVVRGASDGAAAELADAEGVPPAPSGPAPGVGHNLAAHRL